MANQVQLASARQATIIDEAQLKRLAGIADRLLIGQPLAFYGQHSHQQRSGRGQEFLDYRNYSPGDDPRQIDWRASNRSRHPQIRRYRNETASDWYLCLDRSASMALHNKWSLASQLAAALCYLIIHRGNRVSLLTFSSSIDSQIPLGMGRNHYAQLLKLLNTTRPRTSAGSSRPSACISAIKPHSSIITISDFLSADGMIAELKKLQQCKSKIHAFQLLANNECQLNADGPLSLSDIENGDTLNVSSASIASANAQKRLQSLKQQLRHYSRQQGIPLTQCETSESWNEILLRHLSNLHSRPGR